MGEISTGISLCMIVKNEQEHLSESLKAVKDFVDEIIVVDTGSEDRTVEIARDFGARVFHFDWCDDFSAARNYALQFATKEWILNLDADHFLEIQPSIDLHEILKHTNKLGFFIDEQTIDRTGQRHSLERLLLFRNFRGFYYEGAIHEHPGNAITRYARDKQVRDPLGRLSGVVVRHHGYDDPQKKLDRNLRILRKAVKKNPRNFHYHYKFLLTLHSLKHRDFEGELQKTVSLILHENPPLRESVIGIWGLFGDWVYRYQVKNSRDVFISGARQIGKNINWNDFRLVRPYALLLEKQGDYEQAVKLMRHCLQNGVAPLHVALTLYDRYEALYQLLRLHHNHSDAGAFLDDIRQMDNYMEKAGIDAAGFKSYLRQKDEPLSEALSILDPGRKTTKSSGPLLSLCMIVKNEAANLKKCLQSVSGVCEEIIIVDTGSTDNTREIAQMYTNKIFDFTWNGDFSAARNKALEKASGQWILHLDADEALAAETAGQIRSFLSASTQDGVNVIVRNYQPKEDMVRYLDEFQVRLFRNKKSIRYENRIHEQIIPSIARQGGKLADSPLRIDHFGYMQDSNRRNERNLNLLNQQLAEHPMDSYILFKLGETYKAMNELDKAAGFLARAIRNPSGNLTNEIRETIYLRLAQIELARNHYAEAGQYADGCLRFNEHSYIAMYIRGIVDMYLGKTDLALKNFELVKAASASHGLDIRDMERLMEALKPQQNTHLMN